MGLSEEIRRQLIEAFKAEQAEHVQKITQGLLALEKNVRGKQRRAILDEIFREAHSLKGGARAVGMPTVEALGHAIEELLDQAKRGRLAFAPEIFDLLYQALDAVTAVIRQVEVGVTTPSAAVLSLLSRLEQAVAPAAAVAGSEDNKKTLIDSAGAGMAEDENAEAPAGQSGDATGTTLAPGSETIRVSIDKLDRLMAQFSELLGAKVRAEQRLSEMRQLQTALDGWNREWMALPALYTAAGPNGQQSHNQFARPAPARESDAAVNLLTRGQEQLRTLTKQASGLYRDFASDTLRLSVILDELQEEIKRVRMLPLATMTAGFGRMVRDLGRQHDKEIDLVISGEETELDKRVLEQVKDPLIHLLRNAIDHGLETRRERLQAGKASLGRITLSASQQGSNIVIRVCDDGQGLNLPQIRQAAVRRDLLTTAEVDQLSDEEAANLIFRFGLSTSAIITDISGRGVGLDVVRQNVEQLHGTLQVASEPGQGTTFTLTLPLTLASSRGLLVQAGRQTFFLPHATVERMLLVQPEEIVHVAGKPTISYQEKVIVLAWLEDLLSLPPAPRETSCLTVVIIGVAEKRLGLVVDELEGEQEIVVKSLGKQLARLGGIAGATISGSGQVVLVLHPADLIRLATKFQGRTAVTDLVEIQEEKRSKHILVVDDSITTRILEKNILEAAGYYVELATDGEEALNMLIAGALPDLIVCDITMPRLDGLALTRQLKEDARYRAVPVVLVTSLGSPADKARGIEVGADAYIVKSSFDQTNLLEIIEQLIG
jgi:two-component system, chemotaxis family, sensor kinase CheA